MKTIDLDPEIMRPAREFIERFVVDKQEKGFGWGPQSIPLGATEALLVLTIRAEESWHRHVGFATKNIMPEFLVPDAVAAISTLVPAAELAVRYGWVLALNDTTTPVVTESQRLFINATNRLLNLIKEIGKGTTICSSSDVQNEYRINMAGLTIKAIDSAVSIANPGNGSTYKHPDLGELLTARAKTLRHLSQAYEELAKLDEPAVKSS